MTAHREPAPDGRGRPDAEGDRRYGDRAADVRPTREHDPDVHGPQEGYDATADAAERTDADAPDTDADADGR
ncbi:hypothetical protein K353_00375 [Kitasatospora sp. SolWspMP-SS2h]|uniref:hypothetical protein n=1 Tax=Kitasatospora sp. SolWspMP-SS2h TaxID=1305729 RepID=UPI000DBA4BD9|nr:hypothetical protein [Kitasatospora sp. SolWspMP-SS2h]RAJ47174.1 hypothetical protein K353_00375 [Kitasatospora sp. SolWspMP-SS2h]